MNFSLRFCNPKLLTGCGVLILFVVFLGRIWGCNLACLVGISTSGFCFPGYMGQRRVGYVSGYHP